MGFFENDEHIVLAAMADDISKTIFSQRVCFSNTGDEKYIERLLDDTVRIDSQWVGLLRKINELGTCGNLVLFGFGIWGK